MKLLSVVLLLSAICYATAVQRNGRIVGGSDALPGSAPYIIAIKLVWEAIPLPAQTICSGNLLNTEWILTTANCVTQDVLSFGRVELIAGQHEWRVEERSGREQIRTIGSQFTHPNYPGGERQVYDIALVRANEPYVFNEFISAINLPAPNTIPVGNIVSFGWGSTSGFSGQQITVEDVLQTSTHPIIENSLCAEILMVLGFPFGTSAMCTGPLDASISKCYGDFGSPLVQTVDGEPVIVGVFAFTPVEPCNSPNAPQVSVRVSAVLDWISSTIA